MLDNLKNEMNNFLKDLDNNIKNKDDLEYVKIKINIQNLNKKFIFLTNLCKLIKIKSQK